MFVASALTAGVTMGFIVGRMFERMDYGRRQAKVKKWKKRAHKAQQELNDRMKARG